MKGGGKGQSSLRIFVALDFKLGVRNHLVMASQFFGWIARVNNAVSDSFRGISTHTNHKVHVLTYYCTTTVEASFSSRAEGEMGMKISQQRPRL